MFEVAVGWIGRIGWFEVVEWVDQTCCSAAVAGSTGRRGYSEAVERWTGRRDPSAGVVDPVVEFAVVAVADHRKKNHQTGSSRPFRSLYQSQIVEQASRRITSFRPQTRNCFLPAVLLVAAAVDPAADCQKWIR